MPPSPDPIDFEHFPRQPLAFRVTRRQILSTVAAELAAGSRKEQGQPAPRLTDLGLLPDETLANLIPQVPQNVHITVRDGQVFAKPAASVRERRLFPLEAPAVLVFNTFNGATTIQEAAGQLALAQTWAMPKAFAYTRGVFLWLIWNGVCRPVNY
jgi:hypothetical protein